MLKARILVVDDNPLNLKLAADVLENDGYYVNGAPNAEAALERIREQIPDLILMDKQLPGMDGLTLTRALKSDSAIPRNSDYCPEGVRRERRRTESARSRL